MSMKFQLECGVSVMEHVRDLELSRRLFLKGAAATGTATLTLGGTSVLVWADATVINIVSDGDTNVTDWWTNVLKPQFEAANPGLSLNVVITRADGGNEVVAQRVVAAKKTNADPKIDYFEEFDPRNVPGSGESGAFLSLDEKLIPNLALTSAAGRETPYVIPYRGSQVLLAYDSAKVSTAPKTWDELVAWIKANPGQFIYGRPDKGGSGKNFVVRAIHEANGRNPDLFKNDNFNAEQAQKLFAPGWQILADLQPSLYDKGAYPAGNNPTLQLYASGAVSMISAWSDMALQGIAQGVLPPTTKLVQLTDLGLCGGYAWSSIPATTTHQDAVLKLANFMLMPEIQEKMMADFGAFPGIEWKHLSPKLTEQYKDIITSSVPSFPGGDWTAALNDGWYANVATSLARG
jgi:putative spermidine/putrescine transport system substrate-binding protein